MGKYCGPGWLPSWAWPDLIFGDACRIHDEDYTRGGTEQDRDQADDHFKNNMLLSIHMGEYSAVKKAFYFLFAYINFGMVQLFGGTKFGSFRYKKNGK